MLVFRRRTWHHKKNVPMNGGFALDLTVRFVTGGTLSIQDHNGGPTSRFHTVAEAAAFIHREMEAHYHDHFVEQGRN